MALLFFALAFSGIALTRETGRIAALWLPNALLVAALLRSEEQRGAKLVACFAANVSANLASGDSWPLAAGLASCNMLEAFTIVFGMRRLVPAKADLTELRPLLLFMLLAGVLVPAATATLASAVLDLARSTSDWGVWLTYAKGHALGQIVVVPILLILAEVSKARPQITVRHVMEAAGVLGSVVLVCIGVFTQDRFPLLFLVAPFVLLATFRLGAIGATCAVIVAATASGLATFLHTGPIALVDGIGAKVTILQLFVATSFVSALPVAAALAQRARLADALRDSEMLRASITDNIRDVVFRTDRRGRWSFLNPAWEELTGLRVAGSIGVRATSLISFEESDAIGDRLSALLVSPSGELQTQLKFRHADGSLRWVEATIRRQADDEGRLIGTVGSLRDITERHEQALALAARERELRLVTTHSADMIVRTGMDRVRRYVSPRSRTLLGYAPEEIINQAPFFGVHPDDRAAVEERNQQAVESNGPAHSIYRQRHKDGHYIWVEANYSVVRDEATGEPLEFIASVRDFSARKHLEEDLLAARDRAEEAARLKASFLANMSHEIRTPMNGVIGFTELLLTSDLNTEQRRYASLIGESGRTMMTLLNDILDLSKIDANQIEIANEPFDLPHMISGSVRIIAASAAAKGLSIDLLIDGGLPGCAMGDSHRIRQILLNLLSNAVKFTDSGVIRLGATMDSGMLQIIVEDTGSGIAANRQASIFEEFVQGDASIARRYGGTGLGLAISQRLAMLMGGDIRLVKSDESGTRMQVSLPLREAELGVEPPRKASMMRPYALSVRARILVAEDVEINQLLIEALLKRHGHEVHIVSNGAEAIAAFTAAGATYDLILMDMQMPEVDGLEATRHIRALGGAGATVPIVALTANAFASDAEVCRAAGMDAYLSKPMDAETVIATIARLISDRPRVRLPIPVACSAEDPPEDPPEDALEDPIVTALRGRYEALKQSFSTELRRLEALLRDTDDAMHAESRAAIAGICHKLSGSAGMFGDARLGDAARKLEEEALCNAAAPALADGTRSLAEDLFRAA
ncbi:PAS domain S-box protein [Sphingomonas sp. PB2P12]|uniref:PAS domain S-box protein n=1 Tax=Sphingomonas sandaracina TaxID=3096157 RepID=UPI002FC5EB4D